MLNLRSAMRTHLKHYPHSIYSRYSVVFYINFRHSFSIDFWTIVVDIETEQKLTLTKRDANSYKL